MCRGPVDPRGGEHRGGREGGAGAGQARQAHGGPGVVVGYCVTLVLWYCGTGTGVLLELDRLARLMEAQVWGCVTSL